MPARLTVPQGRAQGFWVTPGVCATGAGKTGKKKKTQKKDKGFSLRDTKNTHNTDW